MLFCGFNEFPMTDQALLPSPQFLFPPILTYNLQLCISTLSFLSLLPPSVIEAVILSLPYFTPTFLSAHSPFCLLLLSCHSLLYAPRPPPHFPSALLFVKPFSALQVCFIATVYLSITLFTLPLHPLHLCCFSPSLCCPLPIPPCISEFTF